MKKGLVRKKHMVGNNNSKYFCIFAARMIDGNIVFEAEEKTIKLGDENAEESEDVAVVSADQADFDVSSLIYEFIILAIPMHRVHPEGKCNPEIMALLLSDQNNEEDIDDSNEIDPRWAALKDLKLNDK